MNRLANLEANVPARQVLEAGATQLGLALSEGQVDALLAYLALIEKWNKVYNLTAVRDPADMLTHHVLDSLAVVAPLRVQLAAMAYALDGADEGQVGPLFRLLDVGAGAGLPGVVVAICCPQVEVVTQTRLAPRRLPSISAWPVSRWPLTP